MGARDCGEGDAVARAEVVTRAAIQQNGVAVRIGPAPSGHRADEQCSQWRRAGDAHGDRISPAARGKGHDTGPATPPRRHHAGGIDGRYESVAAAPGEHRPIDHEAVPVDRDGSEADGIARACKRVAVWRDSNGYDFLFDYDRGEGGLVSARGGDEHETVRLRPDEAGPVHGGDRGVVRRPRDWQLRDVRAAAVGANRRHPTGIVDRGECIEGWSDPY